MRGAELNASSKSCSKTQSETSTRELYALQELLFVSLI